MTKFSAGIHVLVKQGNKYLIIKRSNKARYDHGCWDLPGGGIELGESPKQTAIRETKEEVGLKIKNFQLIYSWAWLSENKYWSIELLATADYSPGRLKLSLEHSDFKWVSFTELKKIRPRSIHLSNLVKYLNNK
ncbi:MAG: NUDIX hydrolase [Patescibacteria group bacterium]